MLDHVKDYYGKTLKTSDDLQTDACCTIDEPPSHIKKILTSIHEEVMARYYGCGLVAPEAMEGMRILDLGSGSGRDVYVLSALVGEKGYVVGVDMTEEQLQVANEYIDYHTQTWDYSKPNVEFHKGYIEKLDELGFEDESFDLIISNCVINLSSDKNAVLQQAYRLLKPGGEMYFSDVYSDRRVPKSLVDNELLYGECLSGALYWNDFIQLAKTNGFADPRLVEDRPLGIENDDIKLLVKPINFYSATYRLFKVKELEYSHENYGQTVSYKGSIDTCDKIFTLDKQHHFTCGEKTPVCGNTYKMLNESRFKKHFEFFGNRDQHQGIFAKNDSGLPFDQTTTSSCC